MYRISDDIYNAITGTITIQEVSCDRCNMILEIQENKNDSTEKQR